MNALILIAVIGFGKPDASFNETGFLASADATQAACADTRHVYSISNTRLVKYDRATSRELAKSDGEAFHLNSGVFWKGKIYCAHSYYPRKPDDSDIRVCDPETMKLTIFHSFKNPPGSLTWAIPKNDEWWCCFAHYGENNGKTVLVRFDTDWKERGRWTLPAKLIAELDKNSLSGGIWDGDTILATGHDKRIIYRLKPPAKGDVLDWIGSHAAPFTGQGIAADPKTGGLVGIDRGKKRIVFAKSVTTSRD